MTPIERALYNENLKTIDKLQEALNVAALLMYKGTVANDNMRKVS